MTDNKPLVSTEYLGPIHERRCTDILCCLIFTGFLAAMLAVGVIGFKKGDPDLVLYPYDSSGNQCGRPDTSASEAKYLYYPAVIDQANFKGNVSDYRVCVNECPEVSSTNIKCYENSLISCPLGKNYFVITKGNSEQIDVKPYSTSSLWKRFCAPSANYTFFNEVMDDIYVNGLEDWIADISRCWTAMFIILGISIGVSIMYLIILRYFVGLIIWITIFATFVLLAFFGYFIDKIADEDYSGENKKKTREALNTAAVIIYISTGLFLLIFIFMFKRIKLAIAIMKAGAIFLKDVPSIIFVPIIMFFLSFGFFCYWVLALIYIYSSGDLKKTNSAVARISWDDSTRNSLYFELLGIVWISSMKIALTQFIIACTVSIWYFNRDKAAWGSVIKSSYYAIRYHLGTLAFGSLLLSVIKIIKYILWYIKEKVYKSGFEGNKLVKWSCQCLSCYVSCFERFIQFIDKNAYIQTALTGESFCNAAKDAFSLILQNSLRFAALGAIGDIFKVLGKIFITCLTSYIGFLIITHYEPYKSDIQSPIAPTCVFAVISYIVSGIFMSVYEMICDTIIQAYIVDEKSNNQTKFAPGPLKEFMGEHKDKEHTSHCFGCL